MNKRMIALILLAVLVLTLFAACESTKKPKEMLTPEEAQEIAMKDAGLSKHKVSDVHTHAMMQDNMPCYNIHITAGGVEYEYLIVAKTGEILSKTP